MRQNTLLEKSALSPTNGFEHKWNSAYLQKHRSLPGGGQAARAPHAAGKGPHAAGVSGEVPHAGSQRKAQSRRERLNLEPRPDPEPLLPEVTPEAAYPENTVGLHCLSATKIQQRSVERDFIPAWEKTTRPTSWCWLGWVGVWAPVGMCQKVPPGNPSRLGVWEGWGRGQIGIAVHGGSLPGWKTTGPASARALPCFRSPCAVRTGLKSCSFLEEDSIPCACWTGWQAAGQGRVCQAVPQRAQQAPLDVRHSLPPPQPRRRGPLVSPRLNPPWPGSRKPGNLHQEIHFSGWDCGCGGAAGNEDVADVHAHAEPGVQACDLTGCREAGADYLFQKAALRAVHTHLQGEAKRHPETCF